MGKRKIIIRESAAKSIAEAAWFIESKGMIITAEKFNVAVYDFIESLQDNLVTHAACREPKRNLLGLKCLLFRKKYTLVFYESPSELIIHEFLPAKLLHW